MSLVARYQRRLVKTRLRYHTKRIAKSGYKQRVVKPRLRYQGERVTKSGCKQRVAKTRLRYQSERVTGSKIPAKTCQNTVTLPERARREDTITLPERHARSSYKQRVVKTRLRCQSERFARSSYKQRAVKTRLRYQSERVATNRYKQRVVKTRLRYQSERVTGSKLEAKSCEDTITLPERRVAASMQQDRLQQTLGMQDKLSASLVRNPLLTDTLLADQSQSGRDGCAGNRDPTTMHNAAELRFVRHKREEKEFRKLNPKRRSWLRAGAALAARVGSKTDVADTRPQSPCLHARSEAEEIASTWHAQPARVLILCRAQTLNPKLSKPSKP